MVPEMSQSKDTVAPASTRTRVMTFEVVPAKPELPETAYVRVSAWSCITVQGGSSDVVKERSPSSPFSA